MIERVVVPVDRSDSALRALPPARILADASSAELVVATVVAKRAEREPELAALDQRVGATGIAVDRCEVEVNGYTVGQGLEPLCRGPEVLVVTATPGHPHNRLWTGSVAEELVHLRPDGETVLIGPNVDVGRHDLDGPVLGCIDRSGEPGPMLDRTARFARELGLDARFATVLPPSVPATPVHEIDDVKLDILHDEKPAEAIVALADLLGASVLAVGTRERDDLSRLVFGSVAMEIVVRSHQPVLAVHQPTRRR